MLPAISDFFKDTFTENITKLLQPASLIASSIFFILNLLFIFPALVDKDIPIATGLVSLNAALQVVLAVTIVLVIAYLLLSFNNSILKLMTGELWSDSPLLGRSLTKWQKALRTKLEQQEQAQKPISNAKSLETRWERVTRFPEEDTYIGPTALINVLNATSSYIWHHYGIDMAALWPHMQIIIANDSNSALADRIDNEKATLDFLINLTFLLALFAVEQVLLQCFLLRQGWTVLWVLLPLALAYIVYRSAVSKARSWGDAMQMAFDMHRDSLREALGLQPFQSEEDERQVWEKVSRLLLWGDTADEVFDIQPEQTTPKPSVISSANVQTVLQYGVGDVADPVLAHLMPANASAAPTIQRTFQYIDYILLVSNTGVEGNNCVADGIHIVVSDSQIPRIDPPVKAKDWKGAEYTAEIMLANEANIAHQLLWHIDMLPANGSISLQYRLPSRMFKATTNNPQSLLITMLETISSRGDDITYTFSIENTGGDTDATLEVFDNRRPLPDELPLGLLELPDNTSQDKEPDRLSKPERYCWNLGRLSRGQYVLTYTVFYNQE